MADGERPQRPVAAVVAISVGVVGKYAHKPDAGPLGGQADAQIPPRGQSASQPVVGRAKKEERHDL